MYSQTFTSSVRLLLFSIGVILLTSAIAILAEVGELGPLLSCTRAAAV